MAALDHDSANAVLLDGFVILYVVPSLVELSRSARHDGRATNSDFLAFRPGVLVLAHEGGCLCFGAEVWITC